MSNETDDSRTQTLFAAPDMSDLNNGSAELIMRSRDVLDNMAKLSANLSVALRHSERVLQMNRRMIWPKDVEDNGPEPD